MFKVGAAALHCGLAHSIVILLRAMGSPRQVIRKLPRAVAKFSTTSTMEVVESGATSATIAFRLHEGYDHSRLDCRYAQGLITTVPTVFGLPPAQIVHEECESDGFPACIYHLTWERRSPAPAAGTPTPAPPRPSSTPCAGSCASCSPPAPTSSPATTSSTALHRIVARAAEAVLAPAYLLAVADPAGGEPLVHSAGVPDDQVADLAAALLAGSDLGEDAVVVDVASARRNHGRLAALYRDGAGVMGDESSMLAAYAGHAAAALDLIIALEDARQEAERASALLELAHELSAATDAAGVNDVVSEALPRIVGCTSAGILLWDPASGSLQSQSSVGLDRRRPLAPAGDPPPGRGRARARGHAHRPGSRVILDSDTSSPVLRRLLEASGTADVVAVPLLADSTFLGVATAGWRRGEAPTRLDGDVLARLRGVGDQAATALQKARLLETVRHQATHDALTGLPNRVLFLDTLEQAIADARPGRAGRRPVLRPRPVQGRSTTPSATRRATNCCGRSRPGCGPRSVPATPSAGSAATSSRSSCPASSSRRRRRARRAGRRRASTSPFRLDGSETAIGTSVGVAVHDRARRAIPAEQLLREADAAMYRHKQLRPQRPSGAR